MTAEQAEILTHAAQKKLADIASILLASTESTKIDDSWAFIWANLKDKSLFAHAPYPVPCPPKPGETRKLRLPSDKKIPIEKDFPELCREAPRMASLDEKEETLVLQKLLETAKKSNIFLRGLEKNGEISLLLVFWTTIAIWAFGFIQNEALKVGPIDTLGFVVICVMLLPFVSLLIGHFYGWAYWKNVRYARLEEYLTTDFQTRLMQWRVAREKAQTAKTEMQEAFNQAEAEIRNENEKIRLQNQTALDEWQPRYNQWEERKAEFDRQNKIQEEEFYARQSERNSEIDERRAKYLQCDESEVTKYCEAVLQSSFYPKPFDKREFDLEYHSEGKLLIVEYSFPAIDALPRVEEVKYIKSRDELRESEISASQLAQMFDTAVYSVTLSSLYRLFSMDAAGALGTISFNWWVNCLNKANWKWENICILSIQVEKSEFMDVQLKNVDPKLCFKSLKGVGSSKLSSITPIRPIAHINKSDSRFVQSHSVMDELDQSVNLAEMDWGDFEHLIREIFEKEFSVNGWEVKVTQASRDGGVDAIAFDPDPIRWGKIVIQAKRYTNTVGVSAVRDLYGTVMNEGANKGVLVTTASYGPDAYSFAKWKPLTLMSWAELLYLLEKHWVHMRINIPEARQWMSRGK